MVASSSRSAPCDLPYRIDIPDPPPDTLDVLVELGALDIEARVPGTAAILPDHVTPDQLARALNATDFTVSDATARDNNSVWLLTPRPVQIAHVTIASPAAPAHPNTLRLQDSPVFGTGHHPTTALCGEALAEIIATEHSGSLLDVGTGSGILALLALTLGMPRAVGVDIDPDALKVARQNADLNKLADRLQLVHGGPEAVAGRWPMIVANVLAAPLIDMAPALVHRLGPRGRLILSGIPSSLEHEVQRAYRHNGLQRFESRSRAGWTLLIAEAFW